MDVCPGCGRHLAEPPAPSSFGERVAEVVASIGSSWSFVGTMALIMLLWAVSNGSRLATFDPYPFILMNLWISIVTTFQGPVILMSQNRIASRDRSRVEELHSKVDRLLAREGAERSSAA